MAKGRPTLFRCSILLFAVVLSMNSFCHASDEGRKDYIVYMGSLPEATYSLSSIHNDMLGQVVESSDTSSLLIQSYHRSFNGFAAKLTDQEAQKLAGMKQVISVFPNKVYELQTTRSWDYMGFYENTTGNPTGESDVIVGSIDTGIWPELKSFRDIGLGPPPKKWKGVCEGGKNFTCNNKIIGARIYTRDTSDPSARDFQGHGSHTASTAAGNIVNHASFYGLAEGTARGAVPSARLAIYNVCGPSGRCESIHILAAFDDAIADGVDVISVSLGLNFQARLDADEIAIGSFHAMARGILTAQSAGNNGPRIGSLTSFAPWLLTVAASSIDRRFIDKVVLGNGKKLVGLSVNSFRSTEKFVPLIHGSNASSTCSPVDAGLCFDGCLDRDKVKGKIVLCDASYGIKEIHEKDGLGAILQANSLPDYIPSVVPFPSLSLDSNDYLKVYSYINCTRRARGHILKSKVVFNHALPRSAIFSSRGPNGVSPDIMKPDVSAPGVNILAAFSPLAPPSGATSDGRRVKYSILSGTSMSCPHVAGVAAYIKSFHPDWSPSAIKSAIMTTASQMNVTNTKELELAFGSGHINPVKAVDPGLVYEILKDDYVNLLCSLQNNIAIIVGGNATCAKGFTPIAAKDLNYPSMMTMVTTRSWFKIVFTRTVTNVGSANSTYTANLKGHSKLKIKVAPTSLTFRSLKETRSFYVIVSGRNLSKGDVVSTSLEWSDGTHSVRSPIVIHTVSPF